MRRLPEVGLSFLLFFFILATSVMSVADELSPSNKMFPSVKKAAEDGSPDTSGETELGLMHFYGVGRPVDYQKARQHFKRDSKSMTARYLLGIIYRDGLGVSRNPAEAEHWLESAAKSCWPTAPLELGVMLARQGAASPEKQAKAFKWLLIHDAVGSHDPRRFFWNFRVILSPQSVVQAEKEAKKFLLNRRRSGCTS